MRIANLKWSGLKFLGWILLLLLLSCSKDDPLIQETNDLKVKLESVSLDPVYPRADRNSTIYLKMSNTGADYTSGKVQLTLPSAVSMVGGALPQQSFTSWKAGETKTLKFILKSQSTELQEIKIKVLVGTST